MTESPQSSALPLRGRERFLTMDATSHEALQIFQTERHPSTMGLGKSKEGSVDKSVHSAGAGLSRSFALQA